MNDLFFVMFNKFNGEYREAVWKNNCMSRETIRKKEKYATVLDVQPFWMLKVTIMLIFEITFSPTNDEVMKGKTWFTNTGILLVVWYCRDQPLNHNEVFPLCAQSCSSSIRWSE